MKKIFVLLLVAIILVGCGGNDENDGDSSNRDDSAENNIDNSAEDDNDFIVGDIVQTTVEQTIVDEELGYTITVEEMVKNVPNNYGSDYFGIAFKLRIERNSEMTLIGGLDFQLLVDDEGASERFFSNFSDYVDQQGWEPISKNITNGESSEGWLIFEVTDADADLTFRYSRPELPVTVLGGENYTIPAEVFDIEL